MSDPRRKVGVPQPRNPITGKSRFYVSPRTRVRELATDNGWAFKYARGDYRFTRDDLTLMVHFDRFKKDSIETGILFRPGSRGISLTSKQVEAVLNGETCSCPLFTDKQWESGLDATYSPDCPVHKKAAA